MEGRALGWFQWVDAQEPFTSWRELRTAIIQRFSHAREGDPTERLMALRQTGGVAEYRDTFEALAASMRGVFEPIFKGAFLNGLREDIRAEVRMHRPINLLEAMDLAQQVEDRLDAVDRVRRSKVGQSRPNTHQKGFTAAATKTPHITGGETGFRRLTFDEVQQRKARGLCFRCDEKYSPGHRCKSRTLQVLMLADDDSEGEGQEEPALEEVHDPVGSVAVEMAALSLNSVNGCLSAKTMKVKGTVQGREVVILVDSGASHSFISSSLVKEMDLPRDLTVRHQIQVGNGMIFRQEGVCRAVQVMIQGRKVVENFFSFDLGNMDLVLGVTWLRTLGEVRADWTRFTLKFREGGQWSGVLLEIRLVSNEERDLLADLAPPELAEVLDQFQSVFELPEGLPPRRACDHHIVLRAGASPPNIRPYSWRFCVDYRVLNQLRVPDKYPIPIINELLDELHRACVFSKLDLRAGYHQIRVREEDVEKTAFWTHEGHYEFLVMPFGLINAPATFQSLMNTIFRPFLRKFVLVFFDDILIYSRTQAEHIWHLELVLQVLQGERLYANHKKCTFGSAQVDYLGHVIFNEGVSADPSKAHAITSCPTPRLVRELRGFLGLTGYYCRFVDGYGVLARPLTKKRSLPVDSTCRGSILAAEGLDGKPPGFSFARFWKELCFGDRRIWKWSGGSAYARGSTYSLFQQRAIPLCPLEICMSGSC
ncbi:uncharacterized protein LOC112094195 [Morus notabilis]|uniref:uncharacterized protein LOC112094195 n=1 Tax=Morus notabilis TaxID=981085 RepID=UPI000CED1CB2|nr:uncharacterized protein LOC112094195 [Morus notabilis]